MAATTWDGAFKDMDPLTWQTIVQMQLEDCEQLAAASKGKGKQREGTQSDAQLAMQLYADDLKHSDHYLQDRNMAQSAAMAVLQDGNLIAEAFKEEQQAASDREMAMNLDARGPRQQRNAPAAAGRAAAPASNETQGANKKLKTDVKDPWQDDEMLEKVTAMYMKAPDEPMPDTSEEPDIEGGESSAWAAARETTANRKRPMRTCIACSDEKSFFEVIRVPCGHEYCRDCLDSLFTASMKDETLFPPRCDNQEISLDWVRLWLSSDVAKQFSEKYEELNTKNRTYCHDKKCSEFISENAYNGSIATCPKCTKTTCNSCKNPSHTGDCPDDEAMRQLMATADTQQWQRCYKCTAMVELDQGCYHMRCRCNAQFCYICGQKWKSCACVQWDEERLTRRATQLVDRNPNRRLFRPATVPHAQPTNAATTSTNLAAPATSTGKRRRDSTNVTAEQATALVPEFDDESEWEDDVWFDEFGGPDNDPAGPIYERGAQIANAIEHLRYNHGCEHGHWQNRRGQWDCENCGFSCYTHIKECVYCNMLACKRCTLNRL